MSDQEHPPEEPKGYDVEPAPPPIPRAKIDKPSLTRDFPEDADFDHDPELNAAITGKNAGGVAGIALPGTHPDLIDFVKPGLGPPMLWLIVGALLTIVALVFTGVNAGDHTPYRILLRLYTIALHTGTAVVALYLAAALQHQIVGRIDLAAARMFAAVAAFGALFAQKLHFTPYSVINNATPMLLGAIAYLAIVIVTFRLWKREPLAYVVGGHFILWLVVQIAMALSAAIAAK
jgi:hypothetical protein